MRIAEMAAVVGGKYEKDGDFSGFAIDSRQVKSGNMFVCIRGAKVDGHDYIENAVALGAAAVLCDRPVKTSVPYVLVDDATLALGRYGAWHRSRMHLRLVGVTGSVGKTTTKECIAAVLSAAYPTHKTAGNRNSETGMPLTLLELTEEHRAAVVEMGMSGLGEISYLTKLAKPDIAVITNIGVSHIEHLGSQENILKAKLEITEGLPSDGTLILNGDDPFLARSCNCFPHTVTYGIRHGDVRAEQVEQTGEGMTFTAVTPVGTRTVCVPLFGIHNVYNALAALAVGITADVPLDAAVAGLRGVKNAPMRQNIYRKNSVTVIEDCYNANPDSMRAALRVLHDFDAPRKIAVLGDMLELGARSAQFHEAVGKQLHPDDLLVCYGNDARFYKIGAENAGVRRCIYGECLEDVADTLRDLLQPNDAVLFKASRGMYAERLIAACGLGRE